MSGWSRIKYHSQNERYYKWKQGGQGKEILEAEKPEYLEKLEEFEKLKGDYYDHYDHDHYIERDGQWYVQTKSNETYLFDEKEIPNVKGMKVYEQGDYLDDLFEELQYLPDF